MSTLNQDNYFFLTPRVFPNAEPEPPGRTLQASPPRAPPLPDVDGRLPGPGQDPGPNLEKRRVVRGRARGVQGGIRVE